MSYLYTPTDTWPSSITVPSDTDVGSFGGEISTTVKALAKRNRWLANQIDVTVVDVPVGGFISHALGTVGVGSITVDTTGLSMLMVAAAPWFVAARVDLGDWFVGLVVNGDQDDQISDFKTVSFGTLYFCKSTPCTLYGYTSVQSAALQVTVFGKTTAYGASLPIYVDHATMALVKVRA